MKKRRQHYVWQHYLNPWTTDKKLWCLREGKIFPSVTNNIGHERDFYRVEELTESDIEYVRKLSVDPSVGLLKTANEGWIATFQMAFEYRKQFIGLGLPLESINEEMDVVLNNIEENFLAHIEGESIKYLDFLRSGSIEFFGVEDDKMTFCHNLCIQYLRTKNIKQSILSNMSSIPQINHINIDACWGVMKHIYATNIAFALITNPPVILNVAPGDELITGDQPVINTFAASAGKNNMPTDTEFYYPISPSIALLITSDPAYRAVDSVLITVKEVEEYNRAMYEMSYEQIYARSKVYLEKYAKKDSRTSRDK